MYLRWRDVDIYQNLCVMPSFVLHRGLSPSAWRRRVLLPSRSSICQPWTPREYGADRLRGWSNERPAGDGPWDDDLRSASETYLADEGSSSGSSMTRSWRWERCCAFPTWLQRSNGCGSMRAISAKASGERCSRRSSWREGAWLPDATSRHDSQHDPCAAALQILRAAADCGFG